MKLLEHLNSLPLDERTLLLGRLQGMTLAMRITRNRAEDLNSMHRQASEARTGACYQAEEQEAHNIAALIRLMQVQLGNGAMEFPELTAAELDEINRIY